MYRKFTIIIAFCGVAIGSLLDGDIDLADGVRLIKVPTNSIEDGSRSFGDNSALGRMAKFLEGHELHVRLPTLIEKERVTQYLADALKVVDSSYKENAATGRGKGGGGGGGTAIMGLMFAKAMGAIGLGGIGLLTMKALAVSALALMLAAIVGVKKLTSHEGHDEHQVIYAGHHGHHRRKRDITPLPYRGWTEYEVKE